jgi:peptidoglycan/LPS O-acetylase OafA/YrhL
MTTAVPTNSANRFAHIDGMRAFAVMIVVVAHAGLGHIVPGGSGVTIFFAISGFIITYLVLRERDKTGSFAPGMFYFRRFVKIAPPFFVLLLIPSLIYAIFEPIDWGALLAQVFFVFNWVYLGGGARVMPGTGVVWSLAVEEQFYIAFALVWLMLVRTRYWRSGLLVTAGAAVVVSNTLRFLLGDGAAGEHRIYYGTDTRLDGIALGVITAVLYHWWLSSGARPGRGVHLLSSDVTLVAAVLLYVATLVIRDEGFRYTSRFALQAIAACLVIVYGMLPGDGLLRRYFNALAMWKPVAVIGLASYSIYLAHLTIAYLVEPLLPVLPLPAKAAVLTLAGVSVGIMCYYLIEKPAHAWRAGTESQFKRRADSLTSRP